MSITYFKVVRIMSWSNFNTTCSFFHISMFISNNWYWFIHNWKNNILTNKIFISFVFFINCYCSITK